eukprot:366574-Chlamydomonas_euryale.AAC.7
MQGVGAAPQSGPGTLGVHASRPRCSLLVTLKQLSTTKAATRVPPLCLRPKPPFSQDSQAREARTASWDSQPGQPAKTANQDSQLGLSARIAEAFIPKASMRSDSGSQRLWYMPPQPTATDYHT